MPASTVTRQRILKRVLDVAPSLEKEMLLLSRFVQPGDTCVDIGASYGIYVVPLARLVGRSGEVHAFEPRPRSATVLSVVTRALTPGNVRVHRLAVSDEAGSETLVTPRRRWFLPVPGRTFLKADLGGAAGRDYYPGWRREFGGADEHVVHTVALDDFVAARGVDRVAFMKVDVEGAEQRVFDGAARTLAEHRPVILCELEDRHTRKYGHGADDVVASVLRHDYRAHVFDGHDLTEVDRVRADENNYVFVPVPA